MNNEISRRIEATPERKVIYVDVGNMKTNDAKKYIETIIREKRKNVDGKPTKFKKTMSFLFGWLAYIDAPLFW